MAYRGKYKAKNLGKIIGDPNKMVYRSLWERKFMVYCDNKPEVLRFGSEEIVVPYLSPIDGAWHRYYVDFIVEVLTPNGTTEVKLIEIKPKNQCSAPKRKPKSAALSRKYIREVKTWGINSAKWKYANAYAEERGWVFMIMNEDHLLV